MAPKSRPRPAPATRFNSRPRELLLAGVGAVSLARKQVLSAYANGFQGVHVLRDRAQDAVLAAAAVLDRQLVAVADRADRLRKQANELRAQAEHRFEPILVEWGIRAPAKKPRRASSRPGLSRRRTA